MTRTAWAPRGSADDSIGGRGNFDFGFDSLFAQPLEILFTLDALYLVIIV